MTDEQVSIFSHRIDPRGVVDLLRQGAADLHLNGPDDAWTTATVTIQHDGNPANPVQLRFRHDPTCYLNGALRRACAQLHQILAPCATAESLPRLAQTIGSFRFAMEVEIDVELADAPQEVWDCVSAVAEQLDGCIFMDTGFYDPQFRLLIDPQGGGDPDAVWPDSPGLEVQPQADLEPQLAPPSPQRVARRALALAAVAGRALFEQEDPADPRVRRTVEVIRQWWSELDIDEELEPEEREILHSQLGELDAQQTVDAIWRYEGLAVLAWALGHYELPPHDQLVLPKDLMDVMGVPDAERGRALIAEASLRRPEEIEQLRQRLFAVHWRLVNFRLRAEPMNFAEFARTAWFGPLDITGLELVDGDLSLRGHAIADASEEGVSTATSAAVERHLAANWLGGESVVYSQTPVNT